MCSLNMGSVLSAVRWYIKWISESFYEVCMQVHVLVIYLRFYVETSDTFLIELSVISHVNLI